MTAAFGRSLLLRPWPLPRAKRPVGCRKRRPRSRQTRLLPVLRQVPRIEFCLWSRSRSRLLRISSWEEATIVNVEQEVVRTLYAVLSLDPSRVTLGPDTELLGSIAELDSMAVVSILTALEERFDFIIDDDEVEGRTFATVSSLVAFVRSKLSQ